MENKKYTIGQLNAMKSEELAQYDCWIIRKIRTGEEVPEEVKNITDAIDKKYEDLKKNLK